MTPKMLRNLRRLYAADAPLAAARTGGGLALYPNGDRRRRPTVRFSDAEVGELMSEGVLVDDGGGVVVSAAGRALLRREAAPGGEAFAAQHGVIVDRAVIVGDGALKTVRGYDGNARLRRLHALKDGTGAALLDAGELAAAARLVADWDAQQAGVVRGSDWTAAPLGSGGRGVSNAQERAMAARCDAHARLARVLDALAPPLRRAVEVVCRDDQGLEALERIEKWPARSGKLALKLALAQVATALRSGSGGCGEADAIHHREEAV